MLIRDELQSDRDAVHALNASAFDTPAEADLVDALRREAQSLLSLVAEIDGEIVGHILFSPVTLSNHAGFRMMGLAPMAVTPAHQGTGIGSALVRAGLERCRESGVAAVVVLGHPAYYPRFGFAPASRFSIDSDYDVPAEAFMVVELQRDSLHGRTGRVQYHPAFGSV